MIPSLRTAVASFTGNPVNPRADLSNLSDNELDQLKTALQVVEEAAQQA
jgi:hypothetical protein